MNAAARQETLSHLEGSSGETHHVLPAPATFIIGTDGIIQFQYTNPDYKVRLHPDVLLAAARAYTKIAFGGFSATGRLRVNPSKSNLSRKSLLTHRLLAITTALTLRLEIFTC